MASYNNFQVGIRKNKNVADLSKKPANIYKREDRTEEENRNLAQWIYLFRQNIDVFCEVHLGVKLYPFQKMVLYELGISDNYTMIASRGISKSFLIGLFAISISILYPGSEIVISAASIKQAGLIISTKIEGYFRKNFLAVAIEIKKVTKNNNEYEVDFHNGSNIVVVPSTENSRGRRATTVVYEEARLIDKEIKDAVLSEMLHPRQTPYLTKYPELSEEAREVSISSAGFKSETIWQDVVDSVKAHYCGESSRFSFFDYITSMKYGLKSKKQIEKQRRTKDPITFSREVENLFFSESESAFFRYDILNKSRKLKRAWYPTNLSKNDFDIKRTPDEIRILSMDVAVSSRSDSDNSVVTLFRLLPTNNGYIREINCIITFNGINSFVQAKLLKSLYYQWHGDYVVLDTAGVGAGVYDALTGITKDEESPMGEYPAWGVMRHESIPQATYDSLIGTRTQSLNYLPCIYPIVGSSSLNHDIAVQLKDAFEKGLIHLLVDEVRAEDVIEKYVAKQGKKAEIILSDVSKKVDMLSPYAQTSALISEMISLETTIVNGKVKLKEVAHKRKDRYSSLGYGNYFASLKDAELLKETKSEYNWGDYVYFPKKGFD